VTAFPFQLPAVSSGHAGLTGPLRRLGHRLGELAAGALEAQLAEPVGLGCRALPCEGEPIAGSIRLGISFGALPAAGALEVEAGLAAGLLDLLAGGPGQAPPAVRPTPIEQEALHLLALVALAGVRAEPRVAELAPRLLRSAPAIRSPLTVEVAVTAGPVQGRCAVLLPPAVLQRLSEPTELPPAVAAWRLEGPVVTGSGTAAPDELAALAPDDMVLLDDSPSERVRLILPGLALLGRRSEDHFHLEEMAMPDASLLLTVEVARASLTLGELARIEPGASVALHAPRDGRVVLRLGERAVAAGQLVEIDGALGVRIERVEGPP